MKTNTVNQAKLLLTLALTLAIAVMMTAGVMVDSSANVDTLTSWSTDVKEVTPKTMDGIEVYEITEAAELAWVAHEVNNGNDNFNGKTVKLMKNIDLGAHEWVPIGSSSSLFFSGTFDGGGYTISDLTINNTSESLHFALFGYVGASGTVKDFSVNGSVSSTQQVTAGVAAFNQGTIENVHSSVIVTGNNRVGGIAGANTGTIQNCSNSGQINNGSNVGGLVGIMHGGSIINSYNTGVVTTTRPYVGGIVGAINHENAVPVKIVNVYNTGAITGAFDVGGILGRVELGETTLTNVYNSGNVSGTYSVGSLIGVVNTETVTISNTYYKTGTATDPIGIVPDGSSYTTTAFDGNGTFTEDITVNKTKTKTKDLSVALNAYVSIAKVDYLYTPLKFWTGLSDSTPILPSGNSNSVSAGVRTAKDELIVAELLASDGTVKYRTYLAPEASPLDSNTLFPGLHGVANGGYSLRVAKISPESGVHYRPCIVTGINVEDNRMTVYDLLIKKLPGSEPFVGADDLTAIATSDGYNIAFNEKYHDVDMNGDGFVNFADLAYARNSKVFGTNPPTVTKHISMPPIDPLY